MPYYRNPFLPRAVMVKTGFVHDLDRDQGSTFVYPPPDVQKADRAFDAEVAAEAKRLNRKLAVSVEFTSAIGPALKKRGVKKAGRDRIMDSVRRLKAASEGTDP
jgi:hypothetical protein